MISWEATAPSNIALIKYMGKRTIHKIPFSPNDNKEKLTNHLSIKDKEFFYFKNQSINPSLSYTLNHFITKVRIKESDEEFWSPFEEDPFQNQKFYKFSKEMPYEKNLSEPAQKKFLEFFQFLKRFFLIPKNYTLSSQNNFPTAIGAASSASSFAALTMATYKLAKDRSSLKDLNNNININTLSRLSRLGSGSSCRSFFSPWSVWTNEKATSFTSNWKHLLYQLIVVDAQQKIMSSTKAHECIQTSPHFKNRSDRAKKRFESITQALNTQNWKKCFQISYEEFLDLHSLFETAQPSFKYKTDSSQKVLDSITHYWKKNNDGPLVTMDAGANIHLLYRPDQKNQRETIEKLLVDYTILSNL